MILLACYAIDIKKGVWRIQQEVYVELLEVDQLKQGSEIIIGKPKCA